MDERERKALEETAKDIRALTIREIGTLGVGHIGGAMSIVDLLTLLYYRHMKVDPENPKMAERDRLVLSKGHAGPALYATLARKGFFPLEWLDTLNKGGTNLPSHCDRNRTPGIDMTTGSLGQGLSAACGLALGLKLDGSKATVFCIIGDGESDEGQNWEAAMFAAHRKIDNLVAFTDYNKMQIDGTTTDILDLERLREKWESFGWAVDEVDGHDLDQLDGAISLAKARTDGPSMIVMHTIKGKGCSFCEGQVGSHNMNITPEQVKEACAALGR
ncbi:MAG: transketolase [Spirochaetes bacterium]|nr:transketolase [Spirochaetota bacterium]